MDGAIPLATLEKGKSAAVREIQGGHAFVQRMAELGVLPGTRIRLLRTSGPVIVEARGQRLMIGRGMVDRIMVEPLD